MKRPSCGPCVQPPKRTYLYQYFETYPSREVTEDESFDALHYLVSREKLAEMIEQGIAEGWLASTTVGRTKYYHLKDYSDE